MSRTIYALSTSYVKSAIAVVRVSGEHAYDSLNLITKNKKFKPRNATFCNLYNFENDLIDQALVVCFPKSNSYTGECTVEYNIHGSIAVIKELMSVLSECKNHYLAERGEFTKQALKNNKIDLIQSEGILDLINAETKKQKSQALNLLEGKISNNYTAWSDDLKNILAYIESNIDFSDQDISEINTDELNIKLNKIKSDIDKHLSNSKNINPIRDGIHISLIGAPNVGKSTLINYISNEDIAIVSSIAGTTRDIIKNHLDFKDYPIVIQDTAGIRDTDDIIELEGIKRSIDKVKVSDINIIILDASNFIESYNSVSSFIDERSLVIINKIDSKQDINYKDYIKQDYLEVSILNNKGMKEFSDKLYSIIQNITQEVESSVVINIRHKEVLTTCYEELNLAIKENDDMIKSYHIRNSINCIGKILGNFNIEEVLGIIFSQFCIGK